MKVVLAHTPTTSVKQSYIATAECIEADGAFGMTFIYDCHRCDVRAGTRVTAPATAAGVKVVRRAGGEKRGEKCLRDLV
tara:strand:+ start:162 stop:398 length:237 start_codon:yes stop_codon:yes gene_type:complete